MLDRDGGVVRGARRPGFATGDLKNNFFSFFCLFLVFVGLSFYSYPCALISVVFLGETTYRGSGPDCVFCSYAILDFYDRSFNYVLYFIFRDRHVPSSTKTFLTLTCLFFKIKYALMDDSHTRSAAYTQCFMA